VLVTRRGKIWEGVKGESLFEFLYLLFQAFDMECSLSVWLNGLSVIQCYHFNIGSKSVGIVLFVVPGTVTNFY
jgi:hypothetical protein